MEEVLYNLIKHIQERKTNSGVAPAHVLKIEIDTEVNKALNNLYKDGKIRIGRTLNDKWISVA